MTQSKMTQSGTLTPCQKLGYKTGDKFTHTTIREDEEFFTQGQVITLTDDGSSMPEFEGIDDSGKEDWWYLSLEDVTPYVEPAQETPVVEPPVKLTPAQELGYKVGDKFIINSEGGFDYTIGSEVILIEDDGTSTPLFEKGSHRQFVFLSRVTKVEDYSKPPVQTPVQYSEPDYLSKHDLSKLRDKIAMQQLAVLTPLYWEVQDNYETGKALVQCQVEAAYEYADEMLKQRLKGGSSL